MRAAEKAIKEKIKTIETSIIGIHTYNIENMSMCHNNISCGVKMRIFEDMSLKTVTSRFYM